jgi:hypothetical protein
LRAGGKYTRIGPCAPRHLCAILYEAQYGSVEFYVKLLLQIMHEFIKNDTSERLC